MAEQLLSKRDFDLYGSQVLKAQKRLQTALGKVHDYVGLETTLNERRTELFEELKTKMTNEKSALRRQMQTSFGAEMKKIEEARKHYVRSLLFYYLW